MAVLGPAARGGIAGLLLALVLATPAAAVFGGKPLHEADPLARSVAAVLYRDATGAHLCTAVVLGPRLLLTAAHCTAGDRAAIKVIFGTTLTDVGNERIRSVAAVARAEKTAASKGKFSYQDPDDVALMVLGADVPAGTRFATLETTTALPETLTIAGYGATSELRKPDANGHRELGFEGVLRTATIPVGKTDSALLVGDQGAGAGACTGDSGGPGFAAGRLVGILVGVSSARSSNDYCRGSAWFANLGRWDGWIVSTARKLGQALH